MTPVVARDLSCAVIIISAFSPFAQTQVIICSLTPVPVGICWVQANQRLIHLDKHRAGWPRALVRSLQGHKLFILYTPVWDSDTVHGWAVGKPYSAKSCIAIATTRHQQRQHKPKQQGGTQQMSKSNSVTFVSQELNQQQPEKLSRS